MKILKIKPPSLNGKPLQDLELDEGFLKAYAALTGLVLRPVIGAEFYSKYNSATTNAQREKILVEAGLSMVVSKTLASKFTKVRACFVAGTLIETIDGLRAIETIEQGDLVWSRHEETLEYGYRPVVDTVSFDNKNIYEVVVRDNHGKLETYQTTEEHPFWVVNTGWLPASLLQTGMTLVNRDDQAVLTVISQTKLNKTDTVYNFEVAEFHTYHIGKFGVWVHNSDCVPSGWIERKVWSSLDPSLQKKFNNAISKGIVAPTASQGVIKVAKTEALANQGYTHKLKILGQGGDIRIYGKQQANGHIIYDKIARH